MAGFKKVPDVNIIAAVFNGRVPDVETTSPVFHGTDGNDILTGSMFGDTFVGSRGNDTIDGLGSIDIVSYENASLIINLNPDIVVLSDHLAGVSIDLQARTATKNAFTFPTSFGEPTHEIFVDRLFNIEDAIGTNSIDTIFGSTANNVLFGLAADDFINGREGKDTLFGGDGFDSLLGGAGGDVLFGGAAGDFLEGGAGADRLDGGTNYDHITVRPTLPSGIHQPNLTAVEGDIASYGSSQSSVFVNLMLKGPQAGGDAQGDELINIESVWGSSFDDVITVNGGHAFGSIGHDTLYGTNASDALIGGSGGDRLFGGGGDDFLAGNDYGRFAALGNLDPTPDELYGGDGNDLMIGGPGADILNGGTGDDIYYMVDAGDLISDSAGIDSVVTNLASYTLGSSLENLFFHDDGDPVNHTGTGNAGNNIIEGGYGDDTLFAGAGADTLNGDEGDDLLADLVGNDTIVFSGGADRAIGFGATAGAEQDIIDLSNHGYSSLQDFYDRGGSIIEAGGDTQIQLYDGGPTLILQGVSASNIDETDFFFG